MDSNIMVQQALCNLYILLKSIFLIECSKRLEIDIQWSCTVNPVKKSTVSLTTPSLAL